MNDNMENILKYAFRITHIDNMPHIIKYGIVKHNSPFRNKHFVNIGDQRIIRSRNEVDIKGYRISEYIPFYFGPRSPMLYVVQHGYNGVPRVEPEKIVYCVVKLEDLINSNIDCIFTDGHALSMLSSFYEKDDLIRINDIISYKDVYSVIWNSDVDIDLKRRKEAELLVKSDVSSLLVCGYVVYNEKAKDVLVKLGVDEKKVVVQPSYYF